MHTYILSLTVPFSCPHKFLSLIFFIVIIGLNQHVSLKKLVCYIMWSCVCMCSSFSYLIQSDYDLIIALMQHMRAHAQCTIYEVFSRIILHSCSFLNNLGISLCLIPCLSVSISLSLPISLFVIFHPLYLSHFLYTCLKNRFLFTPQYCLIYSCSS